MKPYYEDDWVTIYNGDCREILPTLPKVDLVLTDPPYNVGVNYGQHDDKMSEEDWRRWAEDWFLWCLGNATTTLVTGQARLPYYGQIEPWKWLLCWWKPAAMGRSPVGFCNWEPVAMWGKGSSGHSDVVRAPIVPDSTVDGHPCPKPLLWAKGLLALFPVDDGEIFGERTVLDPFMGSGTTLRAAKDLNRNAIGIEIEEKYCEIAARRMEQEVFDFTKKPSNGHLTESADDGSRESTAPLNTRAAESEVAYRSAGGVPVHDDMDTSGRK